VWLYDKGPGGAGVPAERLFYGALVLSIDGKVALATGNTLAAAL